MSIVGDVQTTGSVSSALNQAGAEVMIVPAAFVMLAVIDTAAALVFSTVAIPAALKPTTVGSLTVHVTWLVRSAVVLSL
jgi:hypothetical protein